MRVNGFLDNRAALWFVAVLSLALGAYGAVKPASTNLTTISEPVAQSQLLKSMDQTGAIRAGYGVYPPFTDEDPSTGKVSGISIDIVNEIARQVGLKVQWKRFNWNTMAADLKRGEYEILADAVFETPERAREFTFSAAYAYLPIGVAVVKIDETRFKKFDDINNDAVTVAVGQGFAEETLVNARAPKAMLISVPSGQDSAMAINSVLTGRADIAITNLANAQRVVNAHSTTLKILWGENPPAFVPAAFALNLGDRLGADFISASLDNLRSTGIIDAIVKRNRASISLERPHE